MSSEFYGSIFSKKSMKPDSKKVEKIKNFESPNYVKTLRNFLGLANYMKQFINDVSILTHSINF